MTQNLQVFLTIGLLKSNQNIYWILGGIYKKGDKLNLSKKYFNNIKAFIYGKNKTLINQLKVRSHIKILIILKQH